MIAPVELKLEEVVDFQLQRLTAKVVEVPIRNSFEALSQEDYPDDITEPDDLENSDDEESTADEDINRQEDFTEEESEEQEDPNDLDGEEIKQLRIMFDYFNFWWEIWLEQLRKISGEGIRPRDYGDASRTGEEV